MECEAIDRLVDQFYKAGMAGEGWSEVLLDTANAVRGADGAWVVFANPDLEHFEVVSPRSDPAVIAAYQRYWWRQLLHRPNGFACGYGNSKCTG